MFKFIPGIKKIYYYKEMNIKVILVNILEKFLEEKSTQES